MHHTRPVVSGTGCTSTLKLVHLCIFHHSVKYNFKINAINILGRSPLHVACEVNNVQMTETLLMNKATIEQQDHQGFTALHVAVINGSTDCTSLLLDHGAKVNAKDHAQRTPFLLASQVGQTECGRILVARWRKKDCQDK